MLYMMIVGGVVLGIPLAVAGYFFALKAVRRYRQGIQQRLAHRKSKKAESDPQA